MPTAVSIIAPPALFGGPGQGAHQIVELLVALRTYRPDGREQQIRLHRRTAGRSRRRRPILGRGSNRLRHRLSRCEHHHLPARVGALLDHRGGGMGVLAIGMAAGAVLLLLAIAVTAMHFLIVLGFMPVARRLTARLSGFIRMHVAYIEDSGVLGRLLQACELRQWQLTGLAADVPGEPLAAARGQSGVLLTLAGRASCSVRTRGAGRDRRRDVYTSARRGRRRRPTRCTVLAASRRGHELLSRSRQRPVLRRCLGHPVTLMS